MASQSLETTLAVLLTTVSLASSAAVGLTWAVALDGVAAAAAALTVRWPRIASAALGVILPAYVLTPPSAVNLGGFAALIALLGMGMRRRYRLRLIMTCVYGPLLVTLHVLLYPGPGALLNGAALWGTLVLSAWVVGDAFIVQQHREAQSRRTAVLDERMRMSRELHDSVARAVGRASMRLDIASRESDSPELEQALSELRDTSTRLRGLLWELRTEKSRPPGSGARP